MTDIVLALPYHLAVGDTNNPLPQILNFKQCMAISSSVEGQYHIT